MLPMSPARKNGAGLAAIVVNFMLAGYVSATYFSYNDVTELTAVNFDKLVVNSDGVALVHFYAPQSAPCKQLSSKVNAAAANLKGIALIGAVDCADLEAAGKLCQQYGVQGFPTVKLFGPDKTKNPYTGQMMKQPLDYKGDRTSKDLVDAVTKMLTDVHITKIRNAADLKEMQNAAAAAGKVQVLLFTDKTGTTNLYKGLSMQLQRRGLAFGQVHSSAGEVVAEFGVEAFPTIKVIKVDGGSETYTGELKAPAIREFLTGFVGSETEPGAEAGAEAEGGAADGKGVAWSFVRQVEGLGELAALESREDMALIAVHGAEGEDGCKAAREAFLSAAGKMQAVVDTLLVSVPAEDLTHGSAGAAALGRIGVNVAELAADPCELQVVLLPFGEDKAESDIQLRYTGPPDGKELQRWVTGEIPAHLVPELTDPGASEFFTTDPSAENGAPLAPNRVAPKVLLFTNKDEAPGVFRALAVALRGRGNLAFAWVQANSGGSRGVVDSFKPPKVPFLMVVLPSIVPDESRPGDAKLQFGAQSYLGPLKFVPMRAFLSQLAEQVEAAAGAVNDPEIERKTLPQITNQAEFQSYCTEPAGMCLLALLDGTAAGFEEERKSLLSAALHHSRSNSALHFAWIDARQHRSVMQAFGVLVSDLPVLVALSSKRMRFGLLASGNMAERAHGSSGSKGPLLRPELVSVFLSEVLSAKIRTEPLQALPEIREGDGADAGGATDSGAGADAADSADAVAVEEEFDLSDILSEEVEGGSGVGGTKAERLQEIEEQIKAEEEARKAAAKAAKSGSKKKKKSKKSKKSKSASSSSSEEL